MATDGLTKSVVCLAVFVAINAVAVVVVSLIQFNGIASLDAADADVQSDLEDLLLITGKHDAIILDMSSALRRSMENSPSSNGRRQKRAGLQNVFLELLKAQEEVIERHCKNKEKVCKQGFKGAVGRPGMKGEKGDNGRVGLKGVGGIPGPKGTKGDRGPTGDVGVTGDKGAKGSIGIAGPVGEKGAQGHHGFPGPRGEPGFDGAKGGIGQAGLTGTRGINGTKGEPGITGLAGERGQPGVKGAEGLPGENGHDVDKLQPGCLCLKKPTITGSKNAIRRVNVGGTTNFTCSADGFPPPHVSWTGQTNQSELVVYVHGSVDYKTYQCTASNMFGTDTKNATVIPL